MDTISIGLEVTGLLKSKPSGIGVYIKNLLMNLSRLNKNVILFYKLSRFTRLKYIDKFINGNLRWHYNNIYNPFCKKVDIVHVTDNTFLNYRGVPKIFTIHDLAVFKSETQIQEYISERHKLKLAYNINEILKKVDAVIAVSNTTKIDLLEFYNFPEDKINVISLAPNDLPNFNNVTLDYKNYDLKMKGYFLFVGNISIRKNIINLLKAYALNNLSNDYQLVLAGSMGMGIKLIYNTILDLKLSDKVKILNYVPDKVLSSLYKNSAGLVFPTFYEGFGIPILEAMKYKIPFLIGDIGAASETAGGHGIKVSPFSVEQISEGMQTLLETTDSEIEKAFIYSSEFTWEKNAIETQILYKNIMDNY